jgi:hypothetical protein
LCGITFRGGFKKRARPSCLSPAHS